MSVLIAFRYTLLLVNSFKDTFVVNGDWSNSCSFKQQSLHLTVIIIIIVGHQLLVILHSPPLYRLEWAAKGGGELSLIS